MIFPSPASRFAALRMGVRRAFRIGLLALVTAMSLGPLPLAAQSSGGFSHLLEKPVTGAPFSLKVARAAPGIVRLNWTVATGTYLYRDSLKASIAGRPVPLDLPAGETKDDAVFGPVQVFHHDLKADLAGLPEKGRLDVTFQGCSQDGICFPPETRAVALDTLAVGPGLKDGGMQDAAAVAVSPVEPEVLPQVTPETGGALADAGALFSAGLGWTLLAFLGFGLLLSVTPCVFPMIPILAGMLTGAGAGLTPRRGLLLTGVYVLAMAAAYGLVGAVAGWSGANLQTALQTPVALGLAAAVFVALALSMFGLFDLALPAGLSARLSGRAGGGTLGRAALLGFGSALIVGPCVTPPLAGAMLYAASTGDAVTGAAALFMLGLGMGLPLLLVGLFGPALLPRSGLWLMRAKQVFGVLFLAVAILLAGRLLPPSVTLALLGVLLMASAGFFGAFDPITGTSGAAARLTRGTGLAVAVYGAALILGAAGGADDPLRPLAFLRAPAAMAAAPEGVRVTSPTAFEVALRGAGDGPILVDFTAAWCAICKTNAAIMATPALRARLEHLPRITADVTTTNEAARALMTRFGVVGPPTLFLVDRTGREFPGSRIVGPLSSEDLTRRLDAAGA
ncbi:MAG: cytochrome C biogenesis protein [Rhizobiales bacterium 17-65-6]|nr:MAG: cytochrome C biogenesis protein [Rhizobiales bacterium 17-65-6]